MVSFKTSSQKLRLITELASFWENLHTENIGLGRKGCNQEIKRILTLNLGPSPTVVDRESESEGIRLGTRLHCNVLYSKGIGIPPDLLIEPEQGPEGVWTGYGS